MHLTKKNLVRINQEIGETGSFSNESSLDIALSIMKQKKDWVYELSYLVRSILVDNAFSDGNKRTALAVILLYFEEKHVTCDKERILHLVVRIAKGTTDINRIIRIIENEAKH